MSGAVISADPSKGRGDPKRKKRILENGGVRRANTPSGCSECGMNQSKSPNLYVRAAPLAAVNRLVSADIEAIFMVRHWTNCASSHYDCPRREY
jgi:hypothetical protein